MGAGTRGPVQARGVGLAALVVEAVIQGAVDDRVEPAVVAGQLGGVGDVEGNRNARVRRPLTGLLDCRGRTVESGHRVAT